MGQIALSATIHDLAKSVEDKTVSGELQKLAARYAAKVVQEMGK